MAGLSTLQEWLEEHDRTQVQLAKELKVSQPTVSDWIKGNTAPNLDNLLQLSSVTGIPVDRLVREAAA